MEGKSTIIDPRIFEILPEMDSEVTEVTMDRITKHFMDGWSINAVAYDLLHPNLSLTKTDDYQDKDGFQVLIPRMFSKADSLIEF